MAHRSAHARWDGNLQDGAGKLALASGSFEGQYSYKSRFEDGTGTNPEELLAASHAGCFTMALTLVLGTGGHDPESIDTDAKVRLQPTSDGGAEITRIDLVCRGRVPGIDADEFTKAATLAKENCPISKALGSVGEITLDAQLEA